MVNTPTWTSPSLCLQCQQQLQLVNPVGQPLSTLLTHRMVPTGVTADFALNIRKCSGQPPDKDYLGDLQAHHPEVYARLLRRLSAPEGLAGADPLHPLVAEVLQEYASFTPCKVRRLHARLSSSVSPIFTPAAQEYQHSRLLARIAASKRILSTNLSRRLYFGSLLWQCS
jgi:hypothetical protein